MRQFINSVYFSQFFFYVRFVNLRVILCALMVALVILSLILHGLHAPLTLPVPTQYADNDPWNG